MTGSAIISPDGVYRYRLERTFEGNPNQRLVFIMLNPSTADASTDDPTIRRCIGFAKREGCGGLVVVNLFALRATDPTALRAASDPVGPENYSNLSDASYSGRVVAAWGAHPFAATQGRKVAWALTLGDRPLYCLGMTRAGAPRHPLYVRGDQPLVRWYPPAEYGRDTA